MVYCPQLLQRRSLQKHTSLGRKGFYLEAMEEFQTMDSVNEGAKMGK